MKAYLWVFVNFEQNNWAQLLLIAEFTYNNTKNASTGYISFDLNYKYHFRISYKENLDPHLQSKIVKELSSKL